jgi:hypothetical protein
MPTKKKVCSKCGSDGPFQKNRCNSDGLQSQCKDCVNKANLPNQRKNHLKTLYGITLEEYDRLLQEQGGLCAICRQPETAQYKGKVMPLHVDHDHATKKVRGLLCRSCNYALGNVRDSILILEAAIRYLLRRPPLG